MTLVQPSSREPSPDGLGKLLVANRGEIASRVIGTAHRMGLETVAVFSDADAELPYVGEAGEAVHLAGSTPAETYLSIEAVLGAARATGAGWVHPGYGFLSEQAAFARACRAAGLTLVGPSAEVIEVMGSKTEAKVFMASAGVPVLPGHTIGVEDTLAGARGAAEEIGYPVLVKAALGGGGRGMRVVSGPSDLESALSSARREAASAFGDGTVFLEQLIRAPRHLEVQILGDARGRVVALHERECSIQRRFQKVIEEAPSPAVDQPLRSRMVEAAIQAGTALRYQGAGTVELILAPDGRFYFLEVNTRLQVEHRVTEMITGLDVVELQLRVARGEPIPEWAISAPRRGHAVEARLYAEDVHRDFTPSGGVLERFRLPASDHVLVDAGYAEGNTVSAHYDAMLAKLIAWGPDRQTATRRLATALAESSVLGVATNQQLLLAVLRHPEWAAGATDTEFLVRHQPTALMAEPAGDRSRVRRLHVVAAALANAAARRSGAGVQRQVRSGFRNVGVEPQRRRVVVDDGDELQVTYRHGRDPLQVELAIDGQPVEVEVWVVRPDRVELAVEGVRRRCRVIRAGDAVWVGSGQDCSTVVELPTFIVPDAAPSPGSLTAPLPGSVAELRVTIGQAVEAGDTLAVLEAMKMEHQIQAPHAGRVAEIGVSVGDQVEPGQTLIVLAADPS